MFETAFFIGILSYIIFFLGILGFLYKNVIIVAVISYVVTALVVFRKKIISIAAIDDLQIKKHKLEYFFILLFLAEVLINFLGVLSPEISFDSLWYHLTLPKLYLQNHRIMHFSGGLLYYSDMPKLLEMLYLIALSFSNEILAKFIHFLFGLLVCSVIYKFSRTYFNRFTGIVAVLVFYSNLVVMWESTVSYVDLGRVFFEITALLGFANFIKEGSKKWLIISALMLGFAITVKVLSISTLLIYIIIFLFYSLQKKNKKFIINCLPLYILCSLIIPLPWFIFSYLNTGSPFYPFFTEIYSIKPETSGFNLFFILKDFVNLFLFPADPVSPIYIICFPAIIYLSRSFSSIAKLILLYSLLYVMIIFITPRTGGGRFVMSCLPSLSLLVGYFLNGIKKNIIFYRTLIFLIVFISFVSIGYRSIALRKYIPFLVRAQTKDNFLTGNLKFSFGDFYDTDKYFIKNIKPSDRVLLFGFHNLYYLDFPFIDSSYIRKGERFNYIAVQKGTLPGEFAEWNLIYVNHKTHVKLYNLGGGKWEYWKH